MTDTFAQATRTRPYIDPCAGQAHCAHWYTIDRDCGRLTEAHSPFCAWHADRDTQAWWTEHLPEECCDACCRGEIDHV